MKPLPSIFLDMGLDLEIRSLKQVTHPPEEGERSGRECGEADPCKWSGKALGKVDAGDAVARTRGGTDLKAAQELVIRFG